MTLYLKTSLRAHKPAFTLIELMVAVSILVIVILAVGTLFQSASRAVGLSQASLTMLSDVRAVQSQLERDIGGMDKSSFLVIRCQIDPSVDPATGTARQDPATGAVRRFDQISFLSYGSFQHRTGSTGTAPFTDNNTRSPAAFIWWGQLAMAKLNSGWIPANATSPNVFFISKQSQQVPLNQVPTGLGTAPNLDNDFTLGRSATILFPQNSSTGSNSSPAGLSISAFQDQTTVTPPLAAIDYNAKSFPSPLTGESNADITESRLDAAATTPADIMSCLRQALGITPDRTNATYSRYEADHYCYRYAALRSPYDSQESDQIINGYFRMHPIALQGVSSLAIDWSDGTVYGAADLDVVTGKTVTTASVGTMKWYGVYDATHGLAKGGTFMQYFVDHASTGATAASMTSATGTTPSSDAYTAIFSYDNPHQGPNNQWPVALRFRYHVADPTGRLPNGRDFVQVVSLPN